MHKRPQRPPQTMKPKVSPTRKRCFHISTCTSAMTENRLQWVPFWMAFRSFWVPWERKSRKKRSQRRRWEVKKSMPEKSSKKGYATRSGPAQDGMRMGGGALKQSHKPRPTDPLDTLWTHHCVPSGHGGGHSLWMNTYIHTYMYTCTYYRILY